MTSQDKQAQEIKRLVFSPPEAVDAFVTYAKKSQQYAGVTWGVPSMDKTIIPMKPGDVVGIIARPGHGKSTLSAYLARKTAKDIVAQESRDCVVYCTFEQSVEEIETFFQIDAGQYTTSDVAWGRVDINTLIANSMKRYRLPVWLIGKSMARRRQSARMTIDNVYEAIRSIETDFDTKQKPRLIVLDYIQIVPVERAADRVKQVGEAIQQSKELALDCGCPVVIAIQAKTQVDTYSTKIPAAGDCQWASEIHQASDKLLGIWRPALTEDPMKTSYVEINGVRYPISLGVKDGQHILNQKLFVAKLQKQRGDAAGYTYALNFAPEYVRLSDMELRDDFREVTL